MKQYSHFCIEKAISKEEKERTEWSWDMWEEDKPLGQQQQEDRAKLAPLDGWCHRASLSLHICWDRPPVLHTPSAKRAQGTHADCQSCLMRRGLHTDARVRHREASQ